MLQIINLASTANFMLTIYNNGRNAYKGQTQIQKTLNILRCITHFCPLSYKGKRTAQMLSQNIPCNLLS